MSNLQLIKALERLPVNPNMGICGNLIQLGIPQCGINHLLTLAEDWPHHSGDYGYPIPESFDEVGDPESVYMCCPSWEGIQRMLRKDLINYLVARLGAEL